MDNKAPNLKECKYYEKINSDQNTIKCTLCPNNCIIQENNTGICNVRLNKEGTLYSLNYNKPCSISIDPIEKKPLFHFYKGEKILSIGTYGCNLKCKFCQNSDISQLESQNTNNTNNLKNKFNDLETITPQTVIEIAKDNDLKLIAFTYNEPTVFFEYMLDIAKLAKDNNIKCVLVSNGFINKKPLEELSGFIDAANIDLKSISNNFYIKLCNARLNPVLESIKLLHKNNIHIELTNLIINNENDNLENIEKLAIWIKENLNNFIPLHLSRAFPMYKMKDILPTNISTLKKAEDICKKHLDNVYIGNI